MLTIIWGCLLLVLVRLKYLPFFKTALDANPKITQFWLSYIDALIKLDRIDDAKAIMRQAKENGAKGDDLDKLGKSWHTE